MGWIERVKDIISGLRASGKKEDEVREIVAQEADKATVRQQEERVQTDVAALFRVQKEVLTEPEYQEQYEAFASVTGEAMRRMFEKIKDAVITGEAALRMIYSSRKQESNNWRKMHGLPMRRKGKRR